MTRTGSNKNETTNLQTPSRKYTFGESKNCRRGQLTKFTSIQSNAKKDNHVDFGVVMCISHMHPTLIKAIGYVTGVIQMLC